MMLWEGKWSRLTKPQKQTIYRQQLKQIQSSAFNIVLLKIFENSQSPIWKNKDVVLSDCQWKPCSRSLHSEHSSGGLNPYSPYYKQRAWSSGFAEILRYIGIIISWHIFTSGVYAILWGNKTLRFEGHYFGSLCQTWLVYLLCISLKVN